MLLGAYRASKMQEATCQLTAGTISVLVLLSPFLLFLRVPLQPHVRFSAGSCEAGRFCNCERHRQAQPLCLFCTAFLFFPLLFADPRRLGELDCGAGRCCAGCCSSLLIGSCPFSSGLFLSEFFADPFLLAAKRIGSAVASDGLVRLLSTFRFSLNVSEPHVLSSFETGRLRS